MIQIEHLTKRFGPIAAVDDLSVRVEPDRVTGLLGPTTPARQRLITRIETVTPPPPFDGQVSGH